jgi:hypothetical protein
MPAKPVPKRHWRSYGDDPLPTREEALAAPLRAFPSWFLRIECSRCGLEKYMAETHATLAGHGDRIIGEIIERMRHDGCGGQAGLVELITAIPGASRPVRRIVLLG